MSAIFEATKAALARHGAEASYQSVSAGVYDIATGSSANTSTTVQLQAYKKHIRASQYNYPDLIGRDAAEFYIANDALAFVPKPQDKITYDSIVYTVVSCREHIAHGVVILYRVIGVKG